MLELSARVSKSTDNLDVLMNQTCHMTIACKGKQEHGPPNDETRTRSRTVARTPIMETFTMKLFQTRH